MRKKQYRDRPYIIRSDNRLPERRDGTVNVFLRKIPGGEQKIMQWLVLIHVLSAIMGIGPTFFGHVLVRINQTPEQLRHSLKLAGRLDFFPKVGGSLAVITGILLIVLNDYGTFTQLWLVGSLVLYVLIQIVVIGFVAPSQKRLAQWVFDEANLNKSELPWEQRKILAKANSMLYVASSMGLVLFVFMILKP